MLSSSNYTRAKLHDFLDPSFYMYLNPELEYLHNITRVEDAYAFYHKHKLPYNAANLTTKPEHVPDKNVFLKDFDYKVYSILYSSNIANDEYIADDVKLSIADDPERLAIIHYHRIGRGNYYFKQTSIESDFNPYLYKVVHGITREMTLPETYYDYLNKRMSNSNSVVIGNINELTYVIGSNITSRIDNLVINKSLIVKDHIHVEKNAFIRGNLHTSPEAMVEIDGGTLAITNDYGTIDTLFGGVGLDVGTAEIQFEASNVLTNVPTLHFKDADTIISSNLFVRQSGMFKDSVLIGDSLTIDMNYSMQCEKKIRVQSTDVMSDSRLKKNIRENKTTDCLDKIMKLNVKTFELIDSPSSKPTVGVIAQEVNTVFPNMVSQTEGFVPFEFVLRCKATDEHVLIVDFEPESKHIFIEEQIVVECVSTGFVFICKICTVVSNLIEVSFENETTTLLIGKDYNIIGRQEKDVMSVDYTQIFCNLLGAVQELNRKVDSLARHGEERV